MVLEHSCDLNAVVYALLAQYTPNGQINRPDMPDKSTRTVGGELNAFTSHPGPQTCHLP